MKWYGKMLSFHLNGVAYKKKRNAFKLKFSKINKNQYSNLSQKVLTFHIPSFWKFIYYTFAPLSSFSYENNSFNKNPPTGVFLYSNTYFFFIILPNYATLRLINREARTVSLYVFYHNQFYGLFCTFFKLFFFKFTQIFFKKIKFKGKGYYAYKNYRNTFALQFGYSHIVRVHFYYLKAKFLAKTSILLFGINMGAIHRASYNFFFIRPINIFTSRGIRFSKQVIYKKVGKISSYR